MGSYSEDLIIRKRLTLAEHLLPPLHQTSLDKRTVAELIGVKYRVILGFVRVIHTVKFENLGERILYFNI